MTDQCYVVERHEPQFAVTLEGVFKVQAAASKYVKNALLVEKKELESSLGEELKIVVDFATVGNVYYCLQDDKNESEGVGFYITEVEYHE